MPKSTIPKNHPATELAKEIIGSHLREGHSAAKWFQMLIDDCLASFGRKLSEPWDKQIEAHLFNLGQLYGQAVREAPFSDVLGVIYQEIASQFTQKTMGQYFTPDSVAQLMAQVNLNPVDFEQKPVVTFCEPAAGSGVLVLAFMDAVRKHNPDHLGKLSVTMIDLDRLCVKISTLQVMANNLFHARNLGEIRVYHGNSLGDWNNLEVFYHASTPTYDALDGTQKPVDDTPPPLLENDPSTEPETPPPSKGQTSIFDFDL